VPPSSVAHAFRQQTDPPPAASPPPPTPSLRRSRWTRCATHCGCCSKRSATAAPCPGSCWSWWVGGFTQGIVASAGLIRRRAQPPPGLMCTAIFCRQAAAMRRQGCRRAPPPPLPPGVVAGTAAVPWLAPQSRLRCNPPKRARPLTRPLHPPYSAPAPAPTANPRPRRPSRSPPRLCASGTRARRCWPASRQT
jgi:hypothetical protein